MHIELVTSINFKRDVLFQRKVDDRMQIHVVQRGESL